MGIRGAFGLVAVVATLAACSSGGGSGSGATPSKLSGEMVGEMSQPSAHSEAAVQMIVAERTKSTPVFPETDLAFGDIDLQSKSYKKLNADGIKWLEEIRAKCAPEKNVVGDPHGVGTFTETKKLSGAGCPVEFNENKTTKVTASSDRKTGAINMTRVESSTSLGTVTDPLLRRESGEYKKKSSMRMSAVVTNVKIAASAKGQLNEKTMLSGEFRANSTANMDLTLAEGSTLKVRMRLEYVMVPGVKELGMIIRVQTPHGPVVLVAHKVNAAAEYKIDGRVVAAAEIVKIMGSDPLADF